MRLLVKRVLPPPGMSLLRRRPRYAGLISVRCYNLAESVVARTTTATTHEDVASHCRKCWCPSASAVRRRLFIPYSYGTSPVRAMRYQGTGLTRPPRAVVWSSFEQNGDERASRAKVSGLVFGGRAVSGNYLTLFLSRQPRASDAAFLAIHWRAFRI